LLTVHGRTRHEIKDRIKDCNWEVIKRIRKEIQIPMVANGGIECFEDIQKCIEETGV